MAIIERGDKADDSAAGAAVGGPASAAIMLMDI
jgi:hypothetical protein